MNKFLRKGLSFALMGTFSSGLVGNNVAGARGPIEKKKGVSRGDNSQRKYVKIAGSRIEVPTNFNIVDHPLLVFRHRDIITGNDIIAILSPGNIEAPLFLQIGDSDEYYCFSTPKIDQLIAELKTIVMEAGKYNNEDRDKLYDLERKYIIIASNLGKAGFEAYKEEEYKIIKTCSGLIPLTYCAAAFIFMVVYLINERIQRNNEKNTTNLSKRKKIISKNDNDININEQVETVLNLNKDILAFTISDVLPC